MNYSVTNSKYHHQTKQNKGLNITTTAGTHRVKPRVASGFHQLEKICNFLLPFSIGTCPPTGLIPLALKALFSKISCDLKAAWGRTCVYCEHVCMCKSGFLALGGITCVRFLSLSQIRLTVASGLCALCSHCCRPVPFTGTLSNGGNWQACKIWFIGLYCTQKAGRVSYFPELIIPTWCVACKMYAPPPRDWHEACLLK